MKLIRDKKGIVVRVVIIFIILILSFALLLPLVLNLFQEEAIDRAACHTSVILRASAAIKGIELREEVPLQCKTENICVTKGLFGGGECENLAGEKDISKMKASNKEGVLDVIADELLDCHQTFGGGKVNFMPRGWTEEKYCFICSRISLDKERLGEIGVITHDDLVRRLDEKKTSRGNSYLDEMWGTNYEDYINRFGSTIGDLPEEYSGISPSNPIDFSGDQIIVLQVIENTAWNRYIGIATGVGTAGVVIVAGILAIPTGGASIAVVVPILASGVTTGALAAGTAYAVSSPDPNQKFQYIPPYVFPDTDETLDSLKCSFETIV